MKGDALLLISLHKVQMYKLDQIIEDQECALAWTQTLHLLIHLGVVLPVPQHPVLSWTDQKMT